MPSLRLQRGVWLKKLRGIEECASIRFGGGGRKGGGAKEYSFSLSEGVVKGLERMAGGSIFLLYTALLSAVQVNVYRYSGVSAVVTGSPKRQKEGVGDEQGNLVAIATEISGDLSFRECLLQVRENLLEAYENQDYPLETLLKDLEWEKGSCFFDMVVCMHGLHQEGGSQDTPATLMWEKEGQAIRGSWRFSEEWCSQKTIAEFSRQIERVLEGGVGNHQVKVRELSWLGEGEQIEMVEGLNASGKGEAGEQTIVELFEEQVKRSPEAVALAEEGKRVRYGELNERANRIGHYLRERGVGPEVKVGLCVERGVELVCGILGVLKAGGVYVPLDPEYPAERLSYMLKDSGATMVLRPAGLMGQLEKKETGGIRDICLADANMEIESQSRENPEKNVNGENLAYVIYTSGSTGRPKGVGVTQTGLAERAHSLGKEYGLQGQDRLLQYVSPSFDAFGEELFPLLLCGGALVLQKDVKLLPSDEMLELIEREQITVLHIPPGYWGELEKHMTRTGRKISSSVRLLITGGEAVYGEQAERWIAATGTELCTAYGPTETTITATMHRRSQREEEKREEEEENCVSLGRPVAHTRVYVLDEGQQVVPVGVVGELYIAGVGVARGYLKNAEQTAEKFLPDPFQRGQRMYRSGDLARWNRSGELGFMGRKDRQVKIRGYRIELGKIEAVLNGCEGVKEAVVEAGTEGGAGGGEKRLVAYIATDEGAMLSSAVLKEQVEKRLPQYMVPSGYIILKELPRTGNGKLDRRKLPASGQQSAGEYQAPRTAVEEILAGIWQQVLKLDRVGIDQNFFELGGDSILTIQIAARANKAGLRLKPHDLFEHQTISQLAGVAGTGPSLDLKRGPVSGVIPLVPAQRWFLEQDWKFPQHCNQSLLLQAQARLDSEAIEHSLELLLARHESLRLRFHRRNGEWEQSYRGSQAEKVFTVVDLSDVPERHQPPLLEKAAQQLQGSLDLGAGPLMRVAQFICGTPRRDRLLIIVQHLAVDIVSWSFLLDDLQTAYEQTSLGEPVRLEPTTFSFPEWALALQKHVASGAADGEIPYWMDDKRNLIQPLPKDLALGPNHVGSRRIISAFLDLEETEILLRRVPKANYCELSDVLVSALLLSLHNWTSQSQFLLDMEGHGREDLVVGTDLSRVVGWFTAIYPAFLQLDATLDLPGHLQHVKRQLRDVPNKGVQYGFLRYLGSRDIQNELSSMPQAGINFNYQGVMDGTLTNASLFALAAESAGSPHSSSGVRRNMFDVVSRIADDRFRIDWAYSINIHRSETVRTLIESFMGAIRSYISACLTEAPAPRADDFPLASLTQQELQTIVKKKKPTTV